MLRTFRLSLATSTVLFALGLAAATAPAKADTILPPGHSWEYTFTNPTGDANWNTTSGIGGIWSLGDAPFGTQTSGDFAYNTFWPADGVQGDDDLWVRTVIDLTGFDPATASWGLGVDNGFKLYANGVLIAQGDAGGFTHRWEYTGDFTTSPLNAGANVIAVALDDYGGATAFDMEITANASEVPAPGGLALMGLGLIGLSALRRRRQAKR